MSGLDLDQNILNLSADTSIGGIAEAGVMSSVDFRAGAKLKRGIDLQIGVGALAELNAGFSKFLAADVKGRAEAKAQLKGQIQAPLDLFNESGMAVRLQAVAQLALSGRFAIGISVGDFLELARQDSRISGIYLRLLEIFLEELNIQAGVSGRVAYSAMAYLNLVVTGRLVEDTENNLDPGFTIAADCGAGLKGDGGWEFFANLGLRNPRRYFRRSVDVIVDELILRIQDEVDDDAQRELVSLLRTPAKIALRGGFELGYALAENAPTFANSGPALAQRCVQVILEELQRILLEHISTLGISLIRKGLHEIGAGEDAWDNAKAEREYFAARLRDIPEDPFDLTPEAIDYWSGVVNGAAGAVITLSGNLVPDSLAESISLVWASAQLAFATTQRVTDASVRASFFGALSAEQRIEAFQGQIVDQAPAPDLVRDYINNKLNRTPTEELRQEHLVEFLTDSAIQKLLDEVPEARPVLEIVAGPDAQPDALAAAAHVVLNNASAFVPTGAGNDVDPEASLRALSEGLQAYINTRIKLELTPVMYDAIDNQPELRLYLDDVIFPTMSFTIETAFDKVLGWSFGNIGYRDALREACSSIVMKLAGRSLVVTTDILMAHAATHASAELFKMAQTVDDPGNFADQLAASLDLDQQLVREVLHESLEICSEVFSPMPDATRKKIRNLLYTIIDNVPANPDADWVDRLQHDAFIPDEGSRTAIFELAEELGTALAGYLQAFFSKVLTRVADLALEELEQLVEALIEQVEVWIEELEELLLEVVKRLMAIPGEILKVVNQINLAMAGVLEDLRDLIDQFPETSEELEESLSTALFSAALPVLHENDKFSGLATFARNLAESALTSSVDAAVSSGLLSPILNALGDVADASDELLSEIQQTMRALREVNPDADVSEQILDILLDRIEDAVRSRFDDKDPGFNLEVRFSFKTPAVGFPGTPLYVPAKEINVFIALGTVSLSLDTVTTIVRDNIMLLPEIEETIRTLGEGLLEAFQGEDTKTELESELLAVTEKRNSLNAELVTSFAQKLEVNVLSPEPGAIYEESVQLWFHVSEISKSWLGLEDLEQQRLFVYLNQEPLPLNEVSVTDLSNLSDDDIADQHKAVTQGEVIGVSAGNFNSAQSGNKRDRNERSLNPPNSAVTRLKRDDALTGFAKVDLIKSSKEEAGHVRSRAGAVKKRENDASLKMPIHKVGKAHSPISKKKFVSSVTGGLELKLKLNGKAPRYGINVLNISVTNGRGVTRHTAVSFIVTPEEHVSDRNPMGPIHKGGFDHLPKDVAKWMNLADRVKNDETQVPGESRPPATGGRNFSGESGKGDDQPFWIGTKGSRNKGSAEEQKSRLEDMMGTNRNMRKLRREIARGLSNASRDVTGIKR